MIHTNRCKHCGKSKEEHLFSFPYWATCDTTAYKSFTDSGLAALDAHKEELYYAAENVASCQSPQFIDEYINKLESILNQIEKEK